MGVPVLRGATSRSTKRSPGVPDLASYVASIVDTAPPLSNDQRIRLRELVAHGASRNHSPATSSRNRRAVVDDRDTHRYRRTPREDRPSRSDRA